MKKNSEQQFENVLDSNKWEFNWPVMQVLIGGRSAIDLSSLRISDEKEAHEFILRYGYDPDFVDDRRLIHAVIIESLAFIERYLIPDKWPSGLKPPDKILYCNSIIDLLMAASPITNEDPVSRAWACAVLRVMHTISHIEGSYRGTGIETARRQILIGFRNSIWTDENGKIWLGRGEGKLELEHVEYKKVKPRQSIILKLLHKPANVAETIYDLIGVRIVTKKLSDVMLVVKFLRDEYLVTFPNCNPTRVRNSLVDTEQFRNNIDMLRSMVDQKKLKASEFETLLEKMTAPMARYKINNSNPHSSSQYRSIQLTCRQLIRIPNPVVAWSQKIDRAILQGDLINEKGVRTLHEVIQFVRSWQGEKAQEVASFFPFEVQILDAESYNLSKVGDASHDRYKDLQVRTARRRVLSEVLKLKKIGSKG